MNCIVWSFLWEICSAPARLRFQPSRVLRQLPVTGGLIFQNQSILPDRSSLEITSFEDEACWHSPHKRRVMFLQMSKQRALYVFGLANVDPFIGIRNSIDPRCGRSIRTNGTRRKRAGNNLFK